MHEAPGQYQQIRVRRDTRPPGAEPPPPRPSVDAFEKGLHRRAKIGQSLAVAISAVGTVFSLGVAWAVWAGENATDTEVKAAIELHDKGEASHPELIEAIEQNADNLRALQQDALPRIEASQRKLEKRSEYQFELGRWQASIIEAERRHRRPPSKPPRLDDLERDLMLGL